MVLIQKLLEKPLTIHNLINHRHEILKKELSKADIAIQEVMHEIEYSSAFIYLKDITLPIVLKSYR